jgi:hypothetical protein
MKLVIKSVQRHIGIYSSRSKEEIRKNIKKIEERKCKKVKSCKNYAAHFPEHCEEELSHVFKTEI